MGKTHTIQPHRHILFPPIENGTNPHCFKSNARCPIQVFLPGSSHRAFFLSFLLSVFRAALQVEKELVRFLTVSRCKEILENKIMTTESDLRTLRGKPVNRMT